METDTRLSRYSIEPLLDEDGNPIHVRRPSPFDVERYKLMARRRILTCEWIGAALGQNPDAVVDRFNLLKRKPNLWVKLADEVVSNQRQYLFMPLFHELDSRAITYLHEAGINIPKRKIVKNFQHQAMTDQVMTSFEIGCRENPSIEMIHWPEIVASPRAPEALKESAFEGIPVEYRYKGETYRRTVRADDMPFGFRRKLDGRQSYIFTGGPEIDCATEPIETSDFSRSAINTKLMAYLTILNQGLFSTYLGVPNYFIPFYTGSVRRMESMMRMLDKLTDGKGSKNILFATHPSIYAAKKAEPSGKALTQAYKRVGHPDFYLNK